MDSDVEAITRLVFEYAERLDAGDLPGVADLFEHAVWRSDRRPDARVGRAEILEMMRATVLLHEDGTPSTRHVTTNLVVDVEPDRTQAAARSYFTVFQARPGLPLQAIVAGGYRDRFRRREGRWEFSEREVRVTLVGDLRFHLARPMPG
ncbi:MAG: nuclear transport factor 2 family protein [Alphaproteobacteria bacterium]